MSIHEGNGHSSHDVGSPSRASAAGGGAGRGLCPQPAPARPPRVGVGFLEGPVLLLFCADLTRSRLLQDFYCFIVHSNYRPSLLLFWYTFTIGFKSLLLRSGTAVRTRLVALVVGAVATVDTPVHTSAHATSAPRSPGHCVKPYTHPGPASRLCRRYALASLDQAPRRLAPHTPCLTLHQSRDQLPPAVLPHRCISARRLPEGAHTRAEDSLHERPLATPMRSRFTGLRRFLYDRSPCRPASLRPAVRPASHVSCRALSACCPSAAIAAASPHSQLLDFTRRRRRKSLNQRISQRAHHHGVRWVCGRPQTIVKSCKRRRAQLWIGFCLHDSSRSAVRATAAPPLAPVRLAVVRVRFCHRV